MKKSRVPFGVLIAALLGGLFALSQVATLFSDGDKAEKNKVVKRASKKGKKKSRSAAKNSSHQPEGEASTRKADEPEPPSQEDETANSVGMALNEAQYATDARPNAEADYYVFLRCAEWCAPCASVRPIAFAAAREMAKTRNVTFVYVSHDQNRQKAHSLFLTKYKEKDIPVIMAEDLPGLPAIPAYSGVPWFFILDKAGNYIVGGNGRHVADWRQHTIVEAAETREPTPAGINSMADFWASCDFFTATTPRADAEYYILLQTASWCHFCVKEMPDVVKEYRAMQKDGRVELVLYSGDKTSDETLRWMHKNGARFPGIPPRKLPPIPGLTLRNSYPSAYLIRANGEVLASGLSRDIIPEWRNLTRTTGKGKVSNQGAPRFASKLAKLQVINNRSISNTADYYVFLTTGSYESTIQYAAPYHKTNETQKNVELVQRCLSALAQAYSQRQGNGKNVELILTAIDPDARRLAPYLKKSGVDFPVVLQRDPALGQVEEYLEPANDIGYVVLDKEGALLGYDDNPFQGHDPAEHFMSKLIEFVRTGNGLQ